MGLGNNREFDYEKALNDALKKDAKYLEKLLVDVDPAWDYSDLLKILTKGELDTIRKFYDIKKCSSLNKAGLATRLSEEVPTQASKWLEYCLIEDLSLIRDIISKGGFMTTDSENPERDYYFRKRGIVFPGNFNDDYKYVIQKDLLSELKNVVNQKNIKDKAQRNTEIIETADGLLQYYGVVKKQSLCDMMYDMFESKHDKDMITAIVDEYLLRDENIIEYGEYYQNGYVVDPQRVIDEQQNLGDIEYYPVSLKEARQAGLEQHIVLNQQQQDLMKYFVDHYKIDVDKAKEYVLIASEESNLDNPMEDRFSFWSNEFEFEDLDAMNIFMGHLQEVHNHSHLWILKGHTPNNVMGNSSEPVQEVRNSKGRKIGRNEQCPCGSGKKYKKCCL